jgi:hypothetical protein
MAIRITDKEIKKIENSLFDTEMMKKLYKFRSKETTICHDEFEVMVDLGITNTVRNSTYLIEFYYLDDLSKPKYLEIRKNFYEKNGQNEENQQVMPGEFGLLGVFIPSDTGMILDLNAIKKCAEKLECDFDNLRQKVLYHEIGHFLTCFGRSRSNANNKNWMNSLYYQELVAQLTAYHCLNKDKDGIIKRLSEVQEDAYKGYLEPEFEIFRDNTDNLFKLILSITKDEVNEIDSLKKLKSIIPKVKLKSEKEILDEENWWWPD